MLANHARRPAALQRLTRPVPQLRRHHVGIYIGNAHTPRSRTLWLRSVAALAGWAPSAQLKVSVRRISRYPAIFPLLCPPVSQLYRSARRVKVALALAASMPSAASLPAVLRKRFRERSARNLLAPRARTVTSLRSAVFCPCRRAQACRVHCGGTRHETEMS
jgi:hypothetical protein